MASQKQKLTFKIKNNLIVNLVEQKNNYLELVINVYLDKNISLLDLINKEAPNDKDLQIKILDIYYKLAKDKIKNKTILNYLEDVKTKEYNTDLLELVDSDVETKENEEDYTDDDIVEVDTDDDEPIINNDEANIKRDEVQKLYINDAVSVAFIVRNTENPL